MILLAGAGDSAPTVMEGIGGVHTRRWSPPDIDVGSAAGRLKQLHEIAGRIQQQYL